MNESHATAIPLSDNALPTEVALSSTRGWIVGDRQVGNPTRMLRGFDQQRFDPTAPLQTHAGHPERSEGSACQRRPLCEPKADPSLALGMTERPVKVLNYCDVLPPVQRAFKPARSTCDPPR